MYEFKAEGMTCGSCAGIITKAVRSIDPKAQVSVDLGRQKVTVKSDQPQAELVQIIEEAGYPVKEARALAG